MKIKNPKIKVQNKSEIQNLKTQKFLILGFLICFGFWILNFGFQAGAMSRASNGKPADTSSQNRQVFLGVFREGAPRNMNYIKKFVEQTEVKPAMVMWYMDWSQPFPTKNAQKVVDSGAAPHIVWEAMYWSYPGKIKIKDIINGNKDDYIRSWAKDIKKFGQTVFLRVGHEFNVGIYPWGVINLDKDPKTYINFYRHVVDIFNREGVKNVKWVWCFNNYSNPDESWNDWVEAYPGDKYVDWIGIDGYNWGKTQTWSGWETFKGLFRTQMRRASKLWPKKPIMIAEFSSAEKGGSKAEWIKEIPAFLKSSMRDIDALVWFDVNKESDWRVKSSKKSLAAFKTAMKDPIFSASAKEMVNYKKSAPEKVDRKTTIALRAKGQIKIDGNLSDWDKSKPLVMKDQSYYKEGTGWQGLKDLSGQAYLMWDQDNLYLAAEINDQMPLVNVQSRRDIWNGDAIEMVIGLDPQADPSRTRFGRKDYQLGFGTGDGKNNPAGMWNWQRRRPPTGGEIEVKKTSNGYILEAKLPWSSFRGKFVPQSGMKLGFDIAFDDADKTKQRERQFIWNGDFYFYKDPSVWGYLELE